MKTNNYIVVALAFLTLGLGATAEDKPAAIKKPIASTEAVDGFFNAAKTSFAAKDNVKAAESIDQAAGLLTTQAKASASPEFGKPLTKQAAVLTKLAADVKTGSVEKEGTLDTEFANTHNVLAAYFQGRAERSLAGQAKDQAATAMNATANHIEAAAKWSGQTLGDTGKATVGLLRKTSGTLVGGAGTVVETSGDILKSGLGLITKLGTKIKGDDEQSDNAVGKTLDATQKGAGTAVETTGKVTEKGAGAVQEGGKKIKDLGDKIKGDDKDK